MAHFERIKDVISTPYSPGLIEQRTSSGWQLVSIEWRRELPDSEAPSEGAHSEDIPFGLRISDDCQRLEVDPVEHQVLVHMMDAVAQDFSFSTIASSLNEQGFRTREGQFWGQVSVFKMLPRLIQIGPNLFSTEEWKARRQKFLKMV